MTNKTIAIIVFLVIIYICVTKCINATTIDPDMSIEIRKDNSRKAFVMIHETTYLKMGNSVVSITKYCNKLYQNGQIKVAELKKLLPRELTNVKIEFNFDKMKLLQIYSPGAVVLERSDHVAFGTNIIMDLSVNQMNIVYYKALMITKGEYCALLIIIVGILGTLVAFFLQKFKVSLSIACIIVGLSILYWIFLKLWQAF